MSSIDPPSRNFSCSSVLKLRKIANQLFIRLPRLIVLVRRLRDKTKPCLAENTIAMADKLHQLEDEQAESELLHTVTVIKTRLFAHRDIIPVSLTFKSFSDFQAAAYYWTTSILLFRLCCSLQLMFPNKACFDMPSLTAAKSRMAADIIMSWEYAFSLGFPGCNQGGYGSLAFLMMMATWGTLRDETIFRDLPVSTTRAWTVQRVQEVLQKFGSSTETDLDETAELFAGGPVTGMLPNVLRMPR